MPHTPPQHRSKSSHHTGPYKRARSKQAKYSGRQIPMDVREQRSTAKGKKGLDSVAKQLACVAELRGEQCTICGGPKLIYPHDTGDPRPSPCPNGIVSESSPRTFYGYKVEPVAPEGTPSPHAPGEGKQNLHTLHSAQIPGRH